MWQKEEEIENYGIPWKVMEGWRKRNCIYIHYLVTNQASIFLASDFCVLVCFVLSSFLQVYQQAGILENSAIAYLILLFTLFLSKFLVACWSPPTFETKSRIYFGYIFPEQSGNPLTRNWTRQPEVYCLFNPKHITVITPWIIDQSQSSNWPLNDQNNEISCTWRIIRAILRLSHLLPVLSIKLQTRVYSLNTDRSDS